MSGLLKITFADGVCAQAQAIHIRHTYGGLVVGLPSTEIDRQILTEIPKSVRRVFGSWPVLILPRDERIIRHLPKVEIWCWFESSPKNHKSQCSCLSVVWHQGKPYPFIAPKVLKSLKAISWCKVAKDVNY
jgi:hypothetical protein